MGLLPLYSRRDEDASHPPVGSIPKSDQSTSESPAPGAVDPWFIVVIVIGILIVATLAIFMCAHYIKSRRGRKTGFHPVGELGSPRLRRRKLGLLERRNVEDVERDMMIRKSLANRDSLTATDPVSQGSSASDRDGQLADPSGNGGKMTGLREDWKAWEARLQGERATSTRGGIGLDQHPAFASYLSIPQPTRMASPVHSVPAAYRYT